MLQVSFKSKVCAAQSLILNLSALLPLIPGGRINTAIRGGQLVLLSVVALLKSLLTCTLPLYSAQSNRFSPEAS